MKTRLFYNTLAFAVCAMAVTSCTENIVDGTQNEGLKPLSISVVDGGYISAGASTRAVDDGVKTTFESGDQIGVYVVNGEAINQKNIPVTFDGTSWTGNIFYFQGSDYIAYYPYDASLGDYKNIDDLKAALLSQTPTDQSDKALYRKADILTAIKEDLSENTTVTFQMAHNMSLLELNIPICTGAKNDAISDLIVTVNDESYKPYYVGEGIFRCVVKPSAEQLTVGGSFVDISANKSVSFSADITPSLNAYNRLNISYEGMSRLLWYGDYFQGSNSETEISKSEIILPAEKVTDVVVAKLLNTTDVSAEVIDSPEWLTVSKSDDGKSIKVTTNTANEATNKENVATIKVTVDGTEYSMAVRQCIPGYGVILNKKLWSAELASDYPITIGGKVNKLEGLFDNQWSTGTDNKLYVEFSNVDQKKGVTIIFDLGENPRKYTHLGLLPRIEWVPQSPKKVKIDYSNDKQSWTEGDEVAAFVEAELKDQSGNWLGNQFDCKLIKWFEISKEAITSRYVRVTVTDSFWNSGTYISFDEFFISENQVDYETVNGVADATTEDPTLGNEKDIF